MPRAGASAGATGALTPAAMRAVPIRGSVERLRATFRDHGVAGLAYKAVDALQLYRRLVIVEIPLAPSPPRPHADAGRVGVRRLERTEDDLRRYAELRPDQSAAEIRARLDAGVECFLALHDGALASSLWAVRRHAHIHYLRCDLDVGPEAGYAFDAFTAAAHRGLDLNSWCSELMRRAMAAAGCRRLFGLQLPENRNAMTLSPRRAHAFLGTAHVLGPGALRRVILAPAHDGALPPDFVLRPCRHTAKNGNRWHSF